MFKLLKFLLLTAFLGACQLPSDQSVFSSQAIFSQLPASTNQSSIIGTWGGWNFSMYEFYAFEKDGSFWEHRIFSKDEVASFNSMRKTTAKWQVEGDTVVVTGNAPDAETGAPGPLGSRQITFSIDHRGKLTYKDNRGGNSGEGYNRIK